MPTGNEVEVTLCLADGTKLTRIADLADITTFLEQHKEFVKVVRCRDCKYSVFERWVDALDIYTCNRTSLTSMCGDCSPTDFCSWGEERSEVKECD